MPFVKGHTELLRNNRAYKANEKQCYIVMSSLFGCMYKMITGKVRKYVKFELTKDIPYLTLMGELCGVYCEYFGNN